MRRNAPARTCTGPGPFRADGATDMLELMMFENRTNRTSLRRSALAVAAATVLGITLLAPTHVQTQGDAITDLPPGVNVETVIIDPTQVTTGMGLGHALQCALPPSGAIEDCRPVVVAARIFR